MPNYRIEEQNDIWNGHRVVVKSTPTASETVDSALGVAALLINNYRANREANAEQAFAAAERAEDKGDYKTALDEFNIVLDVFARQQSNHGGKARILARAGFFAEAEAEANLALQAQQLPDEPQHVFDNHIAVAHSAMSRVDLWRDNFRGLIQHAAAMITLQNDWGYLWRAKGWLARDFRSFIHCI